MSTAHATADDIYAAGDGVRQSELHGAVVGLAQAVAKIKTVSQHVAYCARMRGHAPEAIEAQVRAVVDRALSAPTPSDPDLMTGLGRISDGSLVELSRPGVEAAIAAGFDADRAAEQAEAERLRAVQAERIEAQRREQERAEAERLAAEQAERDEFERHLAKATESERRRLIALRDERARLEAARLAELESQVQDLRRRQGQSVA